MEAKPGDLPVDERHVTKAKFMVNISSIIDDTDCELYFFVEEEENGIQGPGCGSRFP